MLQPNKNTQSDQAVEQTVLDYIRKADLAQLNPVLSALQEKINQHRTEHQGYVPRSIFASVLGIAGQYTCIEYVPRIVDEKGKVLGYLLKQRGSEEQGWEGQYQIPGVAVVIEPERNLMHLAEKRLQLECNMLDWNKNVLPIPEPAGVESHFEKERNATCLTLIMKFDLLHTTFDQVNSKEWKFFHKTNIYDPSIIDHHRNTLSWLNNSQGFELVDLRDKISHSK